MKTTKIVFLAEQGFLGRMTGYLYFKRWGGEEGSSSGRILRVKV
jgi:hypothetical protein